MKYLHIITILTAALSLISCTREPVPGAETEGEGIVLDFLCVSPTTRAGISGTRDGENAWNENLISTLDVFLYTDSGTGNCIMHRKVTPNNNSGKASVSIFTDDATLNTLVPEGNIGFWVYAIANYPGTLVANENNLNNTSIEYLKSLPLNCDFGAAANHQQASFVMDGISFITSIDKNSRVVARGEVGLKRVASKITVQLNIIDGIEVKKTAVVNDQEVEYYERWEPMIEGSESIQMYIENAVRNTTIAAKPVSNPIYFSYPRNSIYFYQSSNEEDAGYPWVADPMYVYPQHWEYASKTSPTKEPTIKLILPWRRISRLSNGIQVNATQRQFYYKIIIPDDTRADDGDDTFLRNFVRNNWYNFKMEVGMMGSETDDAAVELTGHYYVVNWQDKDVVEKQAAIGKARFLSIDPKQHTIFNENTLDMLYTSSHPVAMTVSKGSEDMVIMATKAYYGDKAADSSVGGGTVKVATSGNADYAVGQKYIEFSASQRKALNGGNDWVRVDGDYVKFSHTLNNNMSAGESFDMSPYIVRFTLYHADHSNDDLYSQSVMITQYPAIYITRELNTGTSTYQGYVRIWGNTSASGSWEYVAGTPLGDDTSMYVITTTVLDASLGYILGDPRERNVNNLGLTDNSSIFPSTEGTDRALTNYYKTSNSEDLANTIAPSFRIASSYGRCGNLYSLEDSEKRCASYQEFGYPAGRWRVPTKAELEYITTLSAKSLIPTLFVTVDKNSSARYHSAQSLLQVLSSGSVTEYTDNTTAWVRCVYDEWYWGDEKIDDMDTFTWGDKAR